MKNFLYKLIINSVTDYCYENCLEYVRDHASILDVGIGNGVMMNHYHEFIKDKRLHITGIDINRNYLRHCASKIQEYHLKDYVIIHCQAVETFEPPERVLYDYIFFTMSFMLFQDQGGVLERARRWLKPEGEILFFQTLFKEKVPAIEFIKPKLKYVTTIDFGKVTYENEFLSLLNAKNLKIKKDRLIKREWFKGEYRMTVAAFS
ncbi:MAG: class I SAM-dependent methyltransferase [Deltaproteobacteria bacterium]|nr:class I SAM-dependent methyltransferase [Deltaproteobacteria bacterium]MBW2041561.1 class I SAM-dependent methyltransferase [Deltaproteobacteria bacterium]MBW2131717.1 class I SAM-dependent methyltransferase [Deltaproteobacteria bacterium]